MEGSEGGVKPGGPGSHLRCDDVRMHWAKALACGARVQADKCTETQMQPLLKAESNLVGKVPPKKLLKTNQRKREVVWSEYRRSSRTFEFTAQARKHCGSVLNTL